jgi:hypothetical protein
VKEFGTRKSPRNDNRGGPSGVYTTRNEKGWLMTINKIKTRHNGAQRGSELAALCLVLALIAGGWLSQFIPGVTASAAGHVTATGRRVALHLAERQTSYLNLSAEAAAVPTDYTAGTGLKELADGTVAHALAAADFDEDGVPDLVGGYTGSSGVGVVTPASAGSAASLPTPRFARRRAPSLCRTRQTLSGRVTSTPTGTRT